MTTDEPDCRDIWLEICQRALQDEEFKQHLLNYPDEVMTEYELLPPEGWHFRVVENGPNEMILVLPAPVEQRGVVPPDDTTVEMYHAKCV